MRVLDLFAGIGGFSLGLESVGFETVAFCEKDEYASAVLRKHWPSVPVFPDVRDLTRAALVERAAWPVDVVAGGFPCTNISLAGRREGLDGDESRLWWELHRIIDEVRPRWAIIENVAALRSSGLDVVLGALAEIGYDAEWHCIPASAIGALHRRDRIWIIAYPRSVEHEGGCAEIGRSGAAGFHEADPVGDASGAAGKWNAGSVHRAQTQGSGPRVEDGIGAFGPEPTGAGASSRAVAHTPSIAQSEPGHQTEAFRDQRDARLVAGGGGARQSVERAAPNVAHADGPRLEGRDGGGVRQRAGEWTARPSSPRAPGADYWLAEPDVGRVADGVPARVDRLRCLGNAIVPQIAALIGEAIMEVERAPLGN